MVKLYYYNFNLIYKMYIPPDPFNPLEKPMNKDEAMRIILTCTWNHPMNTILELDEKYQKEKCDKIKE